MLFEKNNIYYYVLRFSLHIYSKLHSSWWVNNLSTGSSVKTWGKDYLRTLVCTWHTGTFWILGSESGKVFYSNTAVKPAIIYNPLIKSAALKFRLPPFTSLNGICEVKVDYIFFFKMKYIQALLSNILW